MKPCDGEVTGEGIQWTCTEETDSIFFIVQETWNPGGQRLAGQVPKEAFLEGSYQGRPSERRASFQ